MVDLDASFFHHILKLAVADPDTPPHTSGHPKGRSPAHKMTVLEIDHREGAPLPDSTMIIPQQGCGGTAFATEPLQCVYWPLMQPLVGVSVGLRVNSVFILRGLILLYQPL